MESIDVNPGADTTASPGSLPEGRPPASGSDTVQRFVDGVVYCIRSGQMVPGQRLVEADLAARFDVSRGSLREGLKHLASIGIVTLTRHRGAVIAALDRKGVADLLEVLEPLCALAARLAAQNCRSESEKRELCRIATRLTELAERRQRADYLEDRRKFYDTLVRMGGNSELGRVLPLARTDLYRAQFAQVQTKSQHKRHASGYAAIAKAVAANDPAKAARAVARHFAATRKVMLAVLQNQTYAAAPSDAAAGS